MADSEVGRRERTYLIADGEKRGPLTISRVKYHPTARRLTAACADRRLALWDLDGEPVKERNREGVPGRLVCPHERGWIRGFDLHPSGESIVTAGSDRRLRLWRWSDDGPGDSPAADVAAHDGWVESAAFSPDGARVASVGTDRRLKLWDARSLAPIASTPAHSGFPRDVLFSRNGRWIVTAGEDGLAIVWDAQTLEEVRRIDAGHVSDQQGQHPALSGVLRAALTHDDRWLLLACGRTTQVYELETGLAIGGFLQFGGDATAGRCGSVLAIGSSNATVVQTYDPAEFQPRAVERPKSGDDKRSAPALPPFPGRQIAQIKRPDFSLGLAFSPDDRRLATGSADGAVEVWHVV